MKVSSAEQLLVVTVIGLQPAEESAGASQPARPHNNRVQSTKNLQYLPVVLSDCRDSHNSMSCVNVWFLQAGPDMW